MPKSSVTTKQYENNLLLLCARARLRLEKKAEIKILLKNGIDWEYLLRFAGNHGLVPLLYRNLYNTCPDLIPEAVFKKLKNHYHKNTHRNLLLSDRLVKILSLFEKNDITAVPYKGTVLAEKLYGNISLRQVGDIDLFLNEGDILNAKGILISEGFEPQFNMTASQEKYFLKTNNEYNLFHRKHGIAVELHWRFTLKNFPFLIDYDRLWKQLDMQSFFGASVRTFSFEDLLLILCVHGSYHLWSNLKWIVDIAELLDVHKKIDWDIVIKHAVQARSERMLFLGLSLANDLFGSDLPENIIKQIEADDELKELTYKIKQRIFDSHKSKVFLDPMHLKMWKGWKEKLRFCLYFFTLSPYDFNYIRLPDLFFHLYYIIRPLRITIMYGKSFLNK